MAQEPIRTDSIIRPDRFVPPALSVNISRPPIGTPSSSPAEAIGGQVDAARQAIGKPPGLLDEKVNPGAMQAYQARRQAASALQGQYVNALGNPGGVTGVAGIGVPGSDFRSNPLPALHAPLATAAAAPAPRLQQPDLSGNIAGTVSNTNTTVTMPQNLNGNVSGSIVAAGVQPPATATPSEPTTVAPPITAPPLASTVPYQPLEKSVGAGGQVEINASGQSPEHLAQLQAKGQRYARNPYTGRVEVVSDSAGGQDFTLPLLQTPEKVPLGAPPALDTTTPNLNVFQAIGSLAREGAAYRGRANVNAQAQSDFDNRIKAQASQTAASVPIVQLSGQASNERIALLNHIATSKDSAARNASAERIAKLNSEALKKQVQVVQIGEEIDPTDPLGTKRKVFGMSMLDDNGKPVVTDLAGNPVQASQTAGRTVTKAHAAQMRKDFKNDAEFQAFLKTNGLTLAR